MKFVLITGAGASGKMTVGQELMKITDLRLFHNHMTIEPVIEVMGKYDGNTVRELREVFFRNFAASDNYGMIFTFIWAFDQPSDWEYIEHVKSIFEPYGTEFYCVELIAEQEVRLARNVTENRLLHKASKRDLVFSRNNNIHLDEAYRIISEEGEMPFDNYMRIHNDHIAPAVVAKMIKEKFLL